MIDFTINGETIEARVDKTPWPIQDFERARDYVRTTEDGVTYILALDVRTGDYVAHPEAVAMREP